MLDTKYVRQQFPALQQDFTFMDNAGGSHTCIQCIDKITEYLSRYNVQHGASYKVSQDATRLLKEAHEKFKVWINARRSEEVIVYSSSTMLLRILSICLAKDWQKGDEIIITNTEHEANGTCWRDLEELGIVVKTWEFDRDSYELSLESLKSLLTPKTRLLTLCQTSNIFGSINDIAAISDIVHENGSLICVDGVAYAPHRRVDVQKMKVDFYVFSCYKVFGPHVGMMYGKYEILEKMKGINHYFIESIPYKFQPGNYNYELTYGLSGVYDYLMESATHHGIDTSDPHKALEKIYDLMADHEEMLTAKLMNYLKSVSEISIIGEESDDKQSRVSTVSFVHKNFKSDDVVSQVDQAGIGIRFGDFYAKGILESLGLGESNGVIRVSLVHYNTVEEVDQLIEVFKNIFALESVE